MTDNNTSPAKPKAKSGNGAFKADPVREPPSAPDPLQAMRALAMPGFDMATFVDNYQKNLAAFTDSSDILMRSAQSIVTRQAEIFGSAMQDTVQMLNSVFAAPGAARPELDQLRVTQELFVKALGNLQEIVEIANRGRTESMQPLTRRVDEVLGRQG